MRYLGGYLLILLAGIALAAPSESLEAGLKVDNLQLSRIEYALQSISRLQNRWPWLSAEETCIVLTDQKVQYLFMCEAPAGSPYQQADGHFRGRPVYVNTTEKAVLGTQSAPFAVFAKQLVGTVMVYHPEHLQTTGFAQDKPWIFITTLEALAAEHSAFGPESTTEEWLSIFIHEFFHTGQLSQPTAKALWGSILKGEINPQHLNALYLNDRDYQAAVNQEYAFLVQSVAQSLSTEQAKNALQTWWEMRQTRLKRFASTYAGDLERTETAYLYIEGVARYVENMFTVSAEQQAPLSLLVEDPHFNGFQASTGQGYAGMWSKTIPQGKYYYALGLHLGLLLDQIDPNWTQTVHHHPRWLIDSVLHLIAK